MRLQVIELFQQLVERVDGEPLVLNAVIDDIDELLRGLQFIADSRLHQRVLLPVLLLLLIALVLEAVSEVGLSVIVVDVGHCLRIVVVLPGKAILAINLQVAVYFSQQLLVALLEKLKPLNGYLLLDVQPHLVVPLEVWLIIVQKQLRVRDIDHHPVVPVRPHRREPERAALPGPPVPVEQQRGVEPNKVVQHLDAHVRGERHVILEVLLLQRNDVLALIGQHEHELIDLLDKVVKALWVGLLSVNVLVDLLQDLVADLLQVRRVIELLDDFRAGHLLYQHSDQKVERGRLRKQPLVVLVGAVKLRGLQQLQGNDAEEPEVDALIVDDGLVVVLRAAARKVLLQVQPDIQGFLDLLEHIHDAERLFRGHQSKFRCARNDSLRVVPEHVAFGEVLL